MLLLPPFPVQKIWLKCLWKSTMIHAYLFSYYKLKKQITKGRIFGYLEKKRHNIYTHTRAHTHALRNNSKQEKRKLQIQNKAMMHWHGKMAAEPAFDVGCDRWRPCPCVSAASDFFFRFRIRANSCRFSSDVCRFTSNWADSG